MGLMSDVKCTKKMHLEKKFRSNLLSSKGHLEVERTVWVLCSLPSAFLWKISALKLNAFKLTRGLRAWCLVRNFAYSPSMQIAPATVAERKLMAVKHLWCGFVSALPASIVISVTKNVRWICLAGN